VSVPTPAIVQAMQRASALLQAGNFPLARATLEQVVQTMPRFVEAHRLLAGALQALGDLAGAERSLRHALVIDPHWAPTQIALGELLASSERPDEAEIHLRAALQNPRTASRATLALAVLLNDAQRFTEVLGLTANAAETAQADLDLLNQRASALAAVERVDEAIALLRRIVASVPTNPVAELNLAGALDNAGEHAGAEASVRLARSKGANSPEATFLHARTLLALARYAEAEAALRETLSVQPLHVDAQQNLAQLIWMRSGDVTAAGEMLDATLRAYPNVDALHVHKANLLLAGSGDARAAYAGLADRAAASDSSAALQISAAQAAAKFDVKLALSHARLAVQTAPMDKTAQRVLAESLLGIGEVTAALRQIEHQLQLSPDDQLLIALQTTAWRILGDPRYDDFCDYAAMSTGWSLDTPSGWSDLHSYLRDLARSLEQLHTLHTHPLHQSLRHGSQTPQNLLRSDDPAIRAFFSAVDGPIRRHMQTIGTGADPLRRRNPAVINGAGYRFKGIWSVRLRGSGYHTNHVHPDGWLSSACYIQLPKAILQSPRDSLAVPQNQSEMDGVEDQYKHPGWLKFGEPGIPTVPELKPQHFIRPEAGLLALFPSYFWHGTVPFAGDDTRLTIAFDLVPAI
jgi:tetratricopeptide (TPR) repeat protein